MPIPQIESAKRFRHAMRSAAKDTVDSLDNFYENWANKRLEPGEEFLKIKTPDGLTLGEQLKNNSKATSDLKQEFSSLFNYNVNNPNEFDLRYHQEMINNISTNLNSDVQLITKQQFNDPSITPRRGQVFAIIDDTDPSILHIKYMDQSGIIHGDKQDETYQSQTFNFTLKTPVPDAEKIKILKQAGFSLPSTPDIHAAKLHNLKEASIKQIKAKHESEIKALQADPNMTTKINNLLGIQGQSKSDTDKVNKFREELLQALKQKQARELQEFEKAHNDVLNKFYNQFNSEMARISFLHRYYDKNKKALGRPADETVEAYISGDNLGDNLLDRKEIQGLAGKVSYNDGQYKLEWKKYEGWLYAFNPPENNIEVLAHAIKAQGSDSITLSINNPMGLDKEGSNAGKPNQEMLRLGRKAYDAARKAGFAEDKIAIKLNNKIYKPDELFGSYKASLDAINERATKQAQRVEAHHEHTQNNLKQV